MDDAWAARFHEFTFRWSELSLDYFLDGLHINHIEIGKIDGSVVGSNPWAKAQSIPTQMRLNLAVPHTTDPGPNRRRLRQEQVPRHARWL